MSKCNNCGAEGGGRFCPNCGAPIEPIDMVTDGGMAAIPMGAETDTTQSSAEDIALEEKIKQDWYIKTWRSEKPTERKIKLCISFISTIVLLVGLILLGIAFWKYTTIKDTLIQSDPLLMLFVYKEITETIYIFVAFGISLFTIGAIADSFATQWEIEKILQWHDNLNIDTRKLAVDIVLAGKNHALYNTAAQYLYNNAHNTIKLTTWKSRIIKNSIGVCIAVAIALCACFYVKNSAEQTLKSIIDGTINIPTASVSSSGIDPTIIIFIVLLTILIIVLLAVPMMKNKKYTTKIDSWIEAQIKSGTFNSGKQID